MEKISKRLLEIVDSLPLKNGLRILEIGCGPGAAAREIVRRYNDVYVLCIDRSAKAIDQATKASGGEIESGKLKFLCTAIEQFEPDDHLSFDFAFAVRVGALDGRHPEIEAEALARIRKVLKPNGKLYIDGGNPIREIDLNN